jgi:threonine dehydrogenase-like Zn-dependent dehydrogenase
MRVPRVGVKALVFTGPSVLEVMDVAEPQPVDGEVVVEVAAAGICGSELHGVKTPGFRTPPLVMGHEFAGVTTDGRRVAVNPLVSCGECDLCRLGYVELCRKRALLGVHRPGGFAERAAVPASAARGLRRRTSRGAALTASSAAPKRSSFGEDGPAETRWVPTSIVAAAASATSTSMITSPLLEVMRTT